MTHLWKTTAACKYSRIVEQCYIWSIDSKQLLELGEVLLVCVKESAEAMLQRRGGTKDVSEVLPGSRWISRPATSQRTLNNQGFMFWRKLTHLSFFWTSTFTEFRSPQCVSRRTEEWKTGGGQGTERSAICSICQGAWPGCPAGNSPVKFTLGRLLSFRKHTILPKLLIPLVPPQCAQAFLTSDLP